ncbi:hypothetical protein ILUMI_08868 [Ignelater luminosus]|uniref:Ion transport domain-containing protein n=1 Tax=Ignelater luminosus TaxID=2038154 RepID=A0A8K0D6V0_IGNLU|nr:hypothetical protein ILUMI_08868 [Ignelater luminosus]
MARSRRCSSPDDDGYKRFTEDIHNVSYGSNSTNSVEGDEMGSRSTLSCETDREVDRGDGHWEMNYHEAAIFLEEGQNNEKFDSHPRHPTDLPAYLLVHNAWYYGLDLITSIILLLLALVEAPSVAHFQLSVGIHGTLELVALAVIGVELVLKLRWIGWMAIFKHKRTMIKGITLIVMVLEALTVLIRQSSHFRVTRALRPIFLVDTRACGGVRRFIRQILQSLPPILDMLALLLFLVCSYALLGYFLFGHLPSDPYFKTLSDSFVSMFVLLTTANFPDVMMPSYAISKWYAAFFISYISTVLYVLMNLMLAVVYETFTGIEKDKFRKLLLHKRQACQLAFRLLVSKQNPSSVRFRQFYGLMRYYSPRTSLRDIILMFWQLNASHSSNLTLDEFINFYDAVTLKWKLKDPIDPWFSAAWPPLRTLCRAARMLVTWRYFEYIVYVIIIGNGVAMCVRILESAESLEEGAKNFSASWDTCLFLSLFGLEIVLKIIGLGWSEYISSGWNIFDICVTYAAIFGSILLTFKPTFTAVVILRPLRLLRLFKLKKRYRDIFGTVVLLSPLMLSTSIVMLVMYYFFAIIGMELFSQYDLRNCCVNSTVEDFYKYSANSTTALGYYYLNCFSNLLTSGVTLFELTVVNNWFITMEAYAVVANQYSRIYFMLFYLFTMVVLTIVVASVLEAFRFRIQYKKQTSKKDEERMLMEEVIIDWNTLQGTLQDSTLLDALRNDFTPGSVTCYLGRRPRTREVLQCHMYTAEISQWMAEADQLELNVEIAETEEQANDRLI